MALTKAPPTAASLPTAASFPFGATARRIAAAIVVTALLPFFAALAVGQATIERLGALAVQPELGLAFEQSLGVYADLASSLKEGMRHEGVSMAADPALVSAASSRQAPAIEASLRALSERHPRVASLSLVEASGEGEVGPSVRRAAGSPSEVKRLTVRTPVAGTSLELVAVMETPAARFAEQERLASFERAYRELESTRRSAYVERPYLLALTAIMLLTILFAVGIGVLVARPVTRGVERLVLAFSPVATGDLVPRVAFEAQDELGALGRSFNATLVELGQSRARVEFLRHMGEWQKVARRLAHEIRNPLTPIQLSVQECARRYDGADPQFARLLATTVEVVEEEVGSLRRLVGRFARFARLPDPELAPCDLGEFLRGQATHLALAEGAGPAGESRAASSPAPSSPATPSSPPSPSSDDDEEGTLGNVDLAFEIPPDPMVARIDREMLHRALINLIRNAAQAHRDAPPSSGGAEGAAAKGRVRVRAGEDAEGLWIAVDDDGPGVAPEIRESLFDPYVTTKRDGTGLGLSIVKKIALDHGGRIEAATSPEGGARFLLRLPRG